jgi:hypothetical protein
MKKLLGGGEDEMSDPHRETPMQEAASLVTIASILIAVGCYVAALNSLPILSPALFWVATCIYHFVPALSQLQGNQVPMLVAAAAVGGAIWIVGMPMSGLIAQGLSAGHLSRLDQQTRKLKRNRERIAKRRRDKDSFDVN